MAERKKPDFIAGLMSDLHVPPPDPANFWKLELDDPRVVIVDKATMEPKLTITVRKIEGNTVYLQITAHPSIRSFQRQ